MMAAAPAVFITGASSGIGRAAALHLARAGYFVIAGVRRQEDARALEQEAPGRLATVLVDVRDSAATGAAAARAAELAGNRLYGLVNNAGVAFGGPLELMATEEVRAVLEVNVAGTLEVTRAVLPLLRAGRGRIINMGSSSGILALPALSAYAASKFALRGLSDALRRELRPQGIAVSLIEAGMVETPIWDKGLAASDELIARADPKLLRLYEGLICSTKGLIGTWPRIPVAKVVQKIEAILRAPRPRPQYALGPDALLFKISRMLPARANDALVRAILPLFARKLK